MIFVTFLLLVAISFLSAFVGYSMGREATQKEDYERGFYDGYYESSKNPAK